MRSCAPSEDEQVAVVRHLSPQRTHIRVEAGERRFDLRSSRKVQPLRLHPAKHARQSIDDGRKTMSPRAVADALTDDDHFARTRRVREDGLLRDGVEVME